MTLPVLLSYKFIGSSRPQRITKTAKALSGPVFYLLVVCVRIAASLGSPTPYYCPFLLAHSGCSLSPIDGATTSQRTGVLVLVLARVQEWLGTFSSPRMDFFPCLDWAPLTFISVFLPLCWPGCLELSEKHSKSLPWAS